MRSAVAMLAGFLSILTLCACTSSRPSMATLPNDMGVITGPLAGGLIGGSIGSRLDQQAKELTEICDTMRTRDGIVSKFKGDLLFSIGKSDLAPESADIFDAFANVMIKYPDSRITIRGYTDSAGSTMTNRRLSEERAQTLRNILVARGITPEFISVLGMGSKKPIATNDTSEGRAKNRRLEVEITMPQENSALLH